MRREFKGQLLHREVSRLSSTFGYTTFAHVDSMSVLETDCEICLAGHAIPVVRKVVRFTVNVYMKCFVFYACNFSDRRRVKIN